MIPNTIHIVSVALFIFLLSGTPPVIANGHNANNSFFFTVDHPDGTPYFEARLYLEGGAGPNVVTASELANGSPIYIPLDRARQLSSACLYLVAETLHTCFRRNVLRYHANTRTGYMSSRREVPIYTIRFEEGWIRGRPSN